MKLRAPFPYFGGKSSVAKLVWERFGVVNNYVEPFFGTGAVLLCCPTPPKYETANDYDCFIANFWRAVTAEPDALADIMDWPINEVDIEARHKWLVQADRKRAFSERMRDDPDYYDLKTAGWWCWGLCAWIGSGWCAGEWHGRGSEQNNGTAVKIPYVTGTRSVHTKRPQLQHGGKGVHRPHVDRPRGAGRNVNLAEWMQQLSQRLRRVRVCCGDWSRVCTDAVIIHPGVPTAIFLDPPYAHAAKRDKSIYAHDSATVANDVREWCLERSDDHRLRIALCGYEGEHEALEKLGWDAMYWKAAGGLANIGNDADSQGKANRHRERIWFSPHCLQPGLF